MPRILTVEGYERLLGPRGGPDRSQGEPGWQGHVVTRRVAADPVTGRPIEGAQATEVTRPFYPDVLRSFQAASDSNGNGHAGGGGKKSGKKGGRGKKQQAGGGDSSAVPTANKAWEAFHDNGTYYAFDRLLNDEMNKAIMQGNGKEWEDGTVGGLKCTGHGGSIKGREGGPSTYMGSN